MKSENSLFIKKYKLDKIITLKHIRVLESVQKQTTENLFVKNC